MAASDVTVKVSVHIDIDGTPISTIIEQPATAMMREHGEGLAVYLHLDGAKLAKAIMPHFVSQVRKDSGMGGAI
ncbi:MAG: hypothetical protein ACXWP0_03675 [Ktedonobacterales bacterium]